MTSDATWALWCGTAKHNTNLYNQGFPSQPCDQLESIKQWKELTELEQVGSDKGCALMREHPSDPYAKTIEVEPARISELMSAAKGHVCEFPLKFLKHDVKSKDLLPQVGDPEYVVPLYTFT